jgi:flagellar assembly protein FliH
MGTFEKFLFENSFDSEQTREARARAAAEAEAAAAPPPASYSEEDLAAARQSAYQEGHAAGLAEVESSQARRLADLLESLPDHLTELRRQLEAQETERRREALEAAVTVVRKLFPQLARQGGLDEIGAVVDSCLERLRDEPRLVIRCADQDLDELRGRIESSATRAGFEGKLVFLADEAIAAGNLRVEWADGGAERDLAGLWREIDAIVERALTPADATGPAAKQETAAPESAGNQPQPQSAAAVEPLRRAQTA